MRDISKREMYEILSNRVRQVASSHSQVNLSGSDIGGDIGILFQFVLSPIHVQVCAVFKICTTII